MAAGRDLIDVLFGNDIKSRVRTADGYHCLMIFVRCGYPRQVFFKMNWFVVGRFYRWAKSLSPLSSKCLTQDTWNILKKNGLELFVTVRTGQ